MRGSPILFLGLAVGLTAGWLAFDPPAPQRAGAMSYQPPTERTGAPGELLCTQCHSIPGSGDGSVSIAVPSEYVPSSNYTITVMLQDSGQQRWGFEAIAYRVDEQTLSLKMAGTFTNLSPLTTIQELGDGRQYVSHTSNEGDPGPEPDGTFAGTADGPVSWSFGWTAPVAGSGPVVWYVAGNAADGSNSPDGDFIYTVSDVSTEGPTTAVAKTTWGKIKTKYR
jgi:hypothetical protein